MANILIIDDDTIFGRLLSRVAEKMDHQTATAASLAESRRLAGDNGPYDVVFLDVSLPDGNGLDMVSEVRSWSGRPEVIIITATGDPAGAEMAIRSGAWDYIEKSGSARSLALPLARAVAYRREKHAGRPTPDSVEADIIGRSGAVRDGLESVAQAAASDAPVLITGETGVGKELFAQAIHRNSSRRNSEFVVVDCAALPASLAESVLFGHEKGAYTSADQSSPGLIAQAHRGTLFLDEVGELPPEVQRAFLRVLQEHRFRPVGGAREVESDFRVISATNRHLDGMAGDGGFRRDLMYRLKGLIIDVPPLRERTSDIKDIADYYVSRACRRLSIAKKEISPDVYEDLGRYPWPGNVRELINAVERAAAAARYEPTIYRRHLPEEIRIYLAQDSIHPQPAHTARREDRPPEDALPGFHEHRNRSDRRYLERLMQTCGDVKEACRIAGLSRSHLYGLLKKHGISRG